MKKYDMELYVEEGSIPHKIFSRIPKGSCVLEMGCSYGRMTKYLKEELQCKVSIVELDEEAFVSAKQYAVDGYCGDLNRVDLQALFGDRQFDFVIFADVLEHLTHPNEVLANVKPLLKEDGEVIISIPNICHNDILVKLYQNRFEYTSLGLLDNTHIHFWGRENLCDFAKDSGYDVLLTDASYVPPFCTEQKADASILPATLQHALAMREYNDIYQYFIVLKKEGWLDAHGLTPVAVEENHSMLQGILHWDPGTEPLRLSHTAGDRFTFTSDVIPSDCKQCRLELRLSGSCLIGEIQATSDLGLCKMIPTNGNPMGALGYFFSDPPQYVISDLSGAKQLSITVALQLFDQKEEEKWMAYQEECAGEVPQLRKEVAQCQEKLQQAKAKEKELQSKLYLLQSSHQQLLFEHECVLRSGCWKVTKPIRVVLDLMKKTKIGSVCFRTARSLKNEGLQKTWKKFLNRITKKDLRSVQRSKPETLDQMVKYAKPNCEKIYLPKNMGLQKEKPGRKILLVSHELNLTGAPIALQYMANTLRAQGDFPVVISPNDGALGDVLCKSGILSMVYPQVYQDDFVLQSAQLFDLIVINTNVGAPLIEPLGSTDVPVLWWIHEAMPSYHQQILPFMPKILHSNIHVYCVGDHAKKILTKFRPFYPVKQLLYCVPDHGSSKGEQIRCVQGQTTFAIVGMQEERKGYDILIRAIRSLDADTLASCKFVFVGRKMHPPIWEALAALLEEYPDHVIYREELNREEMFALYEKIDCLVCPSRDDPMPIVVTEAMLTGKVIICSENTGSAAILKKENAGLVYGNDDPKALAECIAFVSKQEDEALLQLCQNARHAYEGYFAQDVFAKTVETLVDELTQKQQAAKEFGRRNLHVFLSDYHRLASVSDSIFGEALIKQYDLEPNKKTVLLITHELSLTGAPIVLQYFAQSLLRSNTQVLVVSPVDGPLRTQLEAENIPTMVYEKLYFDDFLQKNAQAFDLVVANTVVTFRCIENLRNCQVPVLWWIHDSLASYEVGGFADPMPKELPANTRVVCAGEYAREQLLKYYPTYQAEVLYYSIPDEADSVTAQSDLGFDADQISFAVIGLQDHRKGQDIFADAIELLSQAERSKAKFYFIGKEFDPKQKERIDAVRQKYPENVRYISQLSRAEMMSMYQQCTCIVCSSRDDPLPVFVTEAMMMSRIVICSEHTGSAPILIREQSGLVYENDDPGKLAEQMSAVIADPKQFDEMRKNARLSFENHFSQKAFDVAVQKFCEERYKSYPKSTEPITVSVVIPTYNAGAYAAQQMKQLQSQQGIDAIEVIAVDSGSSDGTPQVFRDYGAKVIEIPQSEFSHSYARNLGAIHATGKTLIFMTQDAMPIDKDWMLSLVSPILCGEVSAVSCTELCPKETDLYYRISSWIHTGFLLPDEKDRLNQFVRQDDDFTLRSKASLNDVTVAIDRKVFAKFLYRFDYAEDLDLGLRLLRAGHSTKILQSTHTVHGHNRPAGYYIKRAYVEAGTLEKIYEAWKGMPKQEKKVARTVVYSAGLLAQGLQRFLQKDRFQYDADAFSKQLCLSLQEALKNKQIADQPLCEDPLYQWCVKELLPYSDVPCTEEADLFHAVYQYVEVHGIRPYLLENVTGILSEEMQQNLLQCVVKQFCLMMGQEMAKITPDMPLYDLVKDLAKGV